MAKSRRIAIDTNVLVALLLPDHPDHVDCFRLLETARAVNARLTLCEHGLAEAFSIMTSLPDPWRVAPEDASKMLAEVLSDVEATPLAPSDYEDACSRLGAAALAGGIIYDLLHLLAAESSRSQCLVTRNVRHFRRLPARRHLEVLTPEGAVDDLTPG